eukprot:Seg1459.8 transcript_id=Seg1459.8/GoldUCD/mRNA.D3Y31 product="Protein pygopus" protein_id=Seg1459.8/GoldUCD/D3Y31
MPKMKKENFKARKKGIEDDGPDGSRPKKNLMRELKDKKKLKKKKTPMGEKLALLKNGTGKKKLKKELVKSKMKPGRKEKVNRKAQKVHFESQPKPEPNENVLFPCGSCGKEVNDNDEAILCEAGCAYWYHRICTGMGNDAYALLTNEDNAEWVCDQCIATKQIPLVRNIVPVL